METNKNEIDTTSQLTGRDPDIIHPSGISTVTSQMTGKSTHPSLDRDKEQNLLT